MIILSIFSFVLDGIVSMLISNNSLLQPLLSLLCLVVVYPYVKKKSNLVWLALLNGFLYDVVYTQTLFLHTIIFILLALLILFFYKYIPCNFISSIVISFVLVIFFRFLTYCSFILVNDLGFSFKDVFISIYSSLILNYIYLLALGFFLKLFYKNKRVY